MLAGILSVISSAFGLVTGLFSWLTGRAWKKAGADEQALRDVKEQDNVNAQAKAVSDAVARDLARDPSGVMRDDGFERKD